MQKDQDIVHKWAGENLMTFSEDEFEIISNGNINNTEMTHESPTEKELVKQT